MFLPVVAVLRVLMKPTALFVALLLSQLLIQQGFAQTTPATEAVAQLKKFLEKNPKSLESLNDSCLTTALGKAEAEEAKKLLWQWHTDRLKVERKQEDEQKKITEGKLEMPYDFTIYGKKPKDGHSLWISMHGGGGAPARVNDQQWNNQKKLYQLEEGIYLAPRAPTNTWNLWHEGHIDRMFTRLIENFVVLHGVNPNRIYMLGYSAGGDGVYQLAPRMADQFAAAAMMAGHPNGVSLLSVRNLPFALQVGGNDSAYKRNEVGAQYGKLLEKYHKEDPEGYTHLVKIHEGKGHWMNLEDKIALPWMAKFTRNPLPDKVVWKQTGVPHQHFYWVGLPEGGAKPNTLVVAQRSKDKITIAQVEGISELILHLDDRMFDLDKPVDIEIANQASENVKVQRNIQTIIKSLTRGDREYLFSAQVTLKIAQN
ncbi:MAG: hypothetical protein R3B84_19505 [Zavarzinella sp.]